MQKNRYHTNGMIPCPILLYEELKSCCKKNYITCPEVHFSAKHLPCLIAIFCKKSDFLEIFRRFLGQFSGYLRYLIHEAQLPIFRTQTVIFTVFGKSPISLSGKRKSISKILVCFFKTPIFLVFLWLFWLSMRPDMCRCR